MKNLLITASVMASLIFVSCEKESTETTTTTQETSNALNAADALQATAGYTALLEDNFNAGSSLTTNWRRPNRTDYNSSICQYKPWKSSIKNKDGRSCLRIEATKHGNIYRSGLLKSKLAFHPGWREEVHVRSIIKVVARQGNRDRNFKDTDNVWPAFWTVQENKWPTKGEIDIMESYSFGGSDRFASNLFYGTEELENDLGEEAARVWNGFSSTSNNGWHTYDMYWKNDRGTRTIVIKVDGVERASYNSNTSSDLDLAKFTSHNVMVNLNIGSDDGIFQNSPKIYDKVWMFVDKVLVEKRKF